LNVLRFIADERRGFTMPEAVLPKLTQDENTRSLPSDPTALLTGDQQKRLAEDLAELARSRRDAETASASLRLA
jgi:hypothetical protein